VSDLEAADALARERALDVTDSFIVQAPAGSGKTTVLTQRYLRLLTTVDEPEQVLAITFTRKAAGEMRERVQKALEGDIENRSPSDALTLELAAAVRAHATRRAWGLEDSAARLRIQTIDAFNGYLANSLPITSQNGFGRTIADAPDDLYASAARETLRHAESDPLLRKDFELILRRLDDSWQRLELLIAGMLPKRAQSAAAVGRRAGAEDRGESERHRERRTGACRRVDAEVIHRACQRVGAVCGSARRCRETARRRELAGRSLGVDRDGARSRALARHCETGVDAGGQRPQDTQQE
jgi:ATP-dependent exoDNAse (exonuclease V) beta subunit